MTCLIIIILQSSHNATNHTSLVCGTYNENDNSHRFAVGTGNSDATRETAFAVTSDGLTCVKHLYTRDGNIYRAVVSNYDSEIKLKSANGTVYKLTVTDEGELSIQESV